MTIDKNSDAWRHSCEIAYIAKLPSREARQVYISGVRKARGEDAAQRILSSLREYGKGLTA